MQAKNIQEQNAMSENLIVFARGLGDGAKVIAPGEQLAKASA